ncbi:MAG: hypothetical protein L3J74_08850 [Bacteroidales bacterium]|nr:hypothetical protein [Bacteroidales bacterium]
MVTKYNDGYIKDEKGHIRSEGYPPAWYKKVIKTEGDRYKIKNAKQENEVKSF